MKNYEEMTERVFQRIHEYEDKQLRRKKALRRILLAASPVCAAFVISIGIYVNGLNKPPQHFEEIHVMTENNSSTAVSSEKYVSTKKAETSAVSTSDSSKKETVETTALQSAESRISETRAVTQENTAVSENIAETASENNAKSTSKAVAQIISTTVKATHTAISLTEQTTAAATQPVTENSGKIPNGVCDLLYSITLDGKDYVQFADFNGKADLFTPDEFIGYGWDFGGSAEYFDNTEIYTAKESKYIFIVRYETGTEIILGRPNNIIVNGREYFTTMWDTAPYTADESNYIGTVSDFEKIDIPYADQLRRENGAENMVLEPECRLYRTAENKDILIAVHENGNVIILHASE